MPIAGYVPEPPDTASPVFPPPLHARPTCSPLSPGQVGSGQCKHRIPLGQTQDGRPRSQNHPVASPDVPGSARSGRACLPPRNLPKCQALVVGGAQVGEEAGRPGRRSLRSGCQEGLAPWPLLRTAVTLRVPFSPTNTCRPFPGCDQGEPLPRPGLVCEMAGPGQRGSAARSPRSTPGLGLLGTPLPPSGPPSLHFAHRTETCPVCWNSRSAGRSGPPPQGVHRVAACPWLGPLRHRPGLWALS